MKIHSTAIVDPKAEIAEDVEIGPFSIVEGEVKIASGCKIASSVVIANGARLAEGVRVFTGAVIATLPQDLKFGGEFTTAEIGRNSTVREYCTINRATSATGRTIVGEDCLLMAYSHIAHDCHLGNKLIIANAVNLAGHVTIQDYAIIGGLVAIHQFVHIGMHCMIGGMFRVAQDVPPYCLAGGWPLKYEGLNIVGLKRRGFSADTIKALKEVYRLIYQSEMLRTEALQRIKSEPMISEVENVVKFYEASERGVI